MAWDRRSMVMATGLVLGAACARSRAAPTRTLVLGQSVPLSGPCAPIGQAFAAGARQQVEAAAARRGPRVVLRQLDDGGDPLRAAANARRLLDGGADILFGFVGTASCDAAASVARQREALLFAPFGAADHLRGPGARHVWHVRPSFADEALRMARHCATLGQDRIALLAEEDALGHAGLAALTQALSELRRPPLVARIMVPAQSDHAAATLARLAALQPHAVIQPALFPATASFVRCLRREGYAGSFLSFSTVGIWPLVATLGQEVRGVIVPQSLPAPRTPVTPLVRDYLASRPLGAAPPSYEALEGFVAARALLRVVQASGATHRAALRQALQASGPVDLGGLVLDLRPAARNRRRPVDLVALREDGRVLQ